MRLARVRSLCVGSVLLLLLVPVSATAQDASIPVLTQPVNDFADVIDPASEAQLDMLIRSLEQASGDIVVVATVRTFQPYADIEEYALEMFENHGRGIGQKGRDNGLLVVVAVDDRRVRVESGYELEQFITDGFAGETIRQVMRPAFQQGDYGAGLVAGVTRIIGRIAEGRNVTLEGVPPPRRPQRRSGDSDGSGIVGLIILFILFNVISGGIRRNRGRRRRGWFSGVGPFGGGFGGWGGFGGYRGGGFGGGGFGGGGFRGGGFGGGGFGGFGGGRSGGGGASGGW